MQASSFAALFARRSALTFEIENSVNDDTIWMNSFHSEAIVGQYFSSLISKKSKAIIINKDGYISSLSHKFCFWYPRN